jgi:UDP-glucose 4-epimerase
MNKTILVTGGSGFIGSHMVVELIEKCYQVVIVDSLVNSKIEVLDSIQTITGVRPKFYELDICDLNSFKKVFEENTFSAVFHFASLKSVGESVTNPLVYYKENLNGLINLLELMGEFKINNLIFSSSATVYGNNLSTEFGFKESDKIGMGITNPYGETKFFQECMLSSYIKSNVNFSAIILRYFNPAGAHKSGLLNESPNGIPNNLYPYIVQVANGTRTHLNIFGSNYPTPDGTCVRDYIHVLDLVKGHVAALEKCSNKPGTHIYNLGSGKGTSVLEMMQAFEEARGITIPYKLVERRPGDADKSFANVDKAFEELGWVTLLTIQDICL